VRSAGFTLDSVLPLACVLAVRKTANLHTGGTIHDVTAACTPLCARWPSGFTLLDIPGGRL
jgi:hypothetical protein